jgi:RNA 3'-terminal phosphate cyclase (ATP)
MLIIDGSHGEGGGQILRTALSLAAVTGRPFRIEQFRAGRPKPGIAAQHLTAIRAAAAIVGATLERDTLGSNVLEFHPRSPPVAGSYHFDIAEAREGGSAGAATLVLQTVGVPLALACGESTVTVNGGTHVLWSPSFDYFDRVWLAMLRRLGVEASAELGAWGFYPAGRGEITLRLRGATDDGSKMFRTAALIDAGALTAIEGRAVSANLPAHIAQRTANRAEALLQPLGVRIAIETKCVHATSTGVWTFLKCAYENSDAGFGALGRRGKPAEEVAEDAAAELLGHHRSGAALDRHLADQILLPLAFAAGASEFTCPEVTRHLETNAWVIEQFETARFEIGRSSTGAGKVKIVPNR